ncbi:MAG: neutral zinc metallopeptidase, partial [Acidobacteria bacterium]|nr:neutral zinc metallopeptidase [Acidobacteriota bacterium]
MRWRGRRESTQVEDRRGRGPIPRAGVGLGCGGIVLVILFSLITGQDPLQLLEMVGGSGQPAPQGPTAGSGGQPQDELGKFASVVLADTEDTWTGIFRQMGRRYELPALVLFEQAVSSACGMNSSAVGPFYCPADQKVYLDLSFFNELERRFGAPGDFAQAYVIAHEIGHHVQNQLGISNQVHEMQQRASRSQANELSVRLELQADCLAGVWAAHAHSERNLLEPGDVEEGLNAAAAIGDDMMQR